MTEYGHDIGNMKAYSDFELTMEIDMRSISKEALQEILGAIPIVRCKDCRHSLTERCCFFYKGEDAMSGPPDEFFCADGELA